MHILPLNPVCPSRGDARMQRDSRCRRSPQAGCKLCLVCSVQRNRVLGRGHDGRVINDPVAVTVLVKGQRVRMNMNDLHVFLAHSQLETLHETARLMWIKVVEELTPCAGCSGVKGRRMVVPWTTNCRSTKSLECSWTCRGRGPGRLVARNT